MSTSWLPAALTGEEEEQGLWPVLWVCICPSLPLGPGVSHPIWTELTASQASLAPRSHLSPDSSSPAPVSWAFLACLDPRPVSTSHVLKSSPDLGVGGQVFAEKRVFPATGLSRNQHGA